jgi:predicted HTH transcriptional regulator
MSALYYANYFKFAQYNVKQQETMQKSTHNCSDRFGKFTSDYAKPTAMGKQERKEQTLELLVKSNCAFTPYVLFRNLKLRGATFERRSVNKYLAELVNEGLVEKIEYEKGNHVYLASDKAHKKFRAEKDGKKRLA